MEVPAQTISVGIAEIRRLLGVKNALLVALKLREAESVLLQDFIGLLLRILDDRLDVLQFDAPLGTALLSDDVAMAEAEQAEDDLRPRLHRRVANNSVA